MLGVKTEIYEMITSKEAFLFAEKLSEYYENEGEEILIRLEGPVLIIEHKIIFDVRDSAL